jgi:hypothetical protein
MTLAQRKTTPEQDKGDDPRPPGASSSSALPAESVGAGGAPMALTVRQGSGRAPMPSLAARRSAFRMRLQAHAYELAAEVENEARRRRLTTLIREADLEFLMELVITLDAENQRRFERYMQPGDDAA